MRPSLFAAAALAVLPATAALAQVTGAAFALPEAKTFRFESQQQTLSMQYVDLPAERPNGHTAVLLHGKNFCSGYWRGTARVLHERGWRVVIPEQIGFCGSDMPRRYQYSFHQLAENTRDLLEQLDLARTTVIAHSMGGMLGTRYALMYPGAVERLVLVNPIGLEDWKAKGVPYVDIDAQYARERAMDAERIEAYQKQSYYDGRWNADYARWARELARIYQGPRGDRFAWSMARTSDMVYTQPVVHEFPRLQVPTALIIGQRDRTAIGRDAAPPAVAQTLGDYPALGRAAAGAIPGATLIELDGLGHLPHIEAPERFEAALLEALDGDADAG
ncbi:alpha/beta fold hydrolase [Coralloluteibacterium stylophorae]|uniref:Alpha/beta hydrolase n=1 Tax=Coralloluteibacterium stylophorae TaxID=1776034 RepID=A0A8J7VU44_9GAMM|nr:alpha/beta hydrolase [Coralloluteibacterium stylophorae]MBS7457859.1 alpha/beta hydrolase [Coralloluteibacterium stylophorae]